MASVVPLVRQSNRSECIRQLAGALHASLQGGVGSAPMSLSLRSTHAATVGGQGEDSSGFVALKNEAQLSGAQSTRYPQGNNHEDSRTPY